MKAINEDDAIRVCIRMRPLLKPYEDEEVWAVDNRTNMIYSTQGQRQDTSNSFSAFTPTNTSYLNDPSFLAGRRDTRRKYYDNQSPYSFPFGTFLHSFSFSQFTSKIMSLDPNLKPNKFTIKSANPSLNQSLMVTMEPSLCMARQLLVKLILCLVLLMLPVFFLALSEMFSSKSTK